MSGTREEYVYMAKLAEQAERYEEMVEFTEKVAAAADKEELTVEERNLLSVAYKNVIGARRASWRIVSSIEQKEESRGNEDHVATIKEYRANPRCDYHRYLAEFKTRSATPANSVKTKQVIAAAFEAEVHCGYAGLYRAGGSLSPGVRRQGSVQSNALDSSLVPIPSKKRSVIHPKPSPVEKLTKDLYSIWHEQQSSNLFGSSEEDLLFERDITMSSVEIGHGGVLLRYPSYKPIEEESESSSLPADIHTSQEHA
ncbi:hypothetical protein M5K25_021522 [Dendrobium thyrsiflorum]|uniref:14-3-3 domain-containing protein n=1 Tax=Dendrobium thyrsiflorum TaxID=117978 RepID=A0ABD0UD88_DENTH